MARRLRAQLTGAFLRPVLPRPYGVEGGWMSDDLLRQMITAQRSTAEDAEARVRAGLMERAGRAGTGVDWVAVDTFGRLVERARLSDLVIAPSRGHMGGDVDFDAGRLGLACGRPLVVISQTDPATSIARRVMICWNGTRESARAWRDAWPIILAADEVALAIVRPEIDFDDLADLRFRLSRWDRRVDTFVDAAGEGLAAEVLRRHASEWGCDLLIIGLYGRSRLSEQLLGGVSREFIADPPCPLLVSH
ncbi:universal stress protein [Phenylobacterium sp. LjRoot164]|uniref:universal stress protein n=1 Tax=unclassified Phenylobacterium TaxID=2640670 RepID=UPI003ECDA26B